MLPKNLKTVMGVFLWMGGVVGGVALFPAPGTSHQGTNLEAPPVKITFIKITPDKPPLRTFHVSVELRNPRNRSGWFVTRHWGERPLSPSGKFKDQVGGHPQTFDGRGYDGEKNGGKGKAIEVCFIGNFRAFYLPPKAAVQFEGYHITAWSDVREFEVWEVSSLLVNGHTPLEKWLPYEVASTKEALIPAHTDGDNLDWDSTTLRSRTDYPRGRIAFLEAKVRNKWTLPLEGVTNQGDEEIPAGIERRPPTP
jgi:hypothetical protein